jgi:hypothetical protein
LLFLEGHQLSSEIKRLVKRKGPLKIAVAYWGSGGLKLLSLNPKRKDLKIVCCLKGGKSDPDLIKRFGKRAKQSDRLHAKIVWTPGTAIVSSANASSNGLPDEEDGAGGLIEAGVSISDPKQLKAIGAWIDRLHRTSRSIKKADLDAARLARNKRLWGTTPPKGKKQSLIDAIRDGGKLEFDKQRIFFLFCKITATKKEITAANAVVRKGKPTIARAYRISEAQLSDVDYYFDWPEIPANAFLIDCDFINGHWRAARMFKSFDTKKTWKLALADGETQRLTLVKPARRSFPYNLSAKDKRLVRECADRLWRKAGRDPEARFISIKEAAPILRSSGGGH